ncbi:hypothetical protein [Nocardia gipuzkoensis]
MPDPETEWYPATTPLAALTALDHPDPAPERTDQPADSFQAYTLGEAAARGGGIVVTATDAGLPTAIRVTTDELRGEPAELAARILRLCGLAAARAGLARREYLGALGLTDDTLALLGLPTEAEVTAAEIADEAEHEYEPRSWLDQEGDQW